jgi:hypothetical protein
MASSNLNLKTRHAAMKKRPTTFKKQTQYTIKRKDMTAGGTKMKEHPVYSRSFN